jgi:hypothetical protein
MIDLLPGMHHLLPLVNDLNRVSFCHAIQEEDVSEKQKSSLLRFDLFPSHLLVSTFTVLHHSFREIKCIAFKIIQERRREEGIQEREERNLNDSE